MPTDKRTRAAVLHIRVTDSEHAAILKAADDAGLSLSAYVLQRCFGDGIKHARRPR